MKSKTSVEVQDQAMKVAKGTQKAGQSKEQTKLIAQGIEKGIAEYKKQHKAKLRDQDKQRKQKIKQQEKTDSVIEYQPVVSSPKNNLPWILLGLSWLGFIGYYFVS